MRCFFRLAADVIGSDHPVLAKKLRRATARTERDILTPRMHSPAARS